jgi:hypothetical protein
MLGSGKEKRIEHNVEFTNVYKKDGIKITVIYFCI